MTASGGSADGGAHELVWLRLLAWLMLVATVVCFLLALLLAGARCDESCADAGDPARSWQDNRDAWQWTAQLVPVGVALCLSIFAVARVSARWRGQLLAVGAVLLGCWAIVMF
jgi:hypothetical protein